MQISSSPLPSRRLLGGLLALGLVPTAAFANRQTTEPLPPTDTDKPRQLDRVIVTARRSEEALKDLPFAVNVISGEAAVARRLTSLEDILRATPGVEVNSWGGVENANVRIRGVGSLYQASKDDASVVVNIDGVPTSVGHTGLGTLDTDQIEILKGPQGTLFGRGSEAGAINIQTRRPTRHFEAYLRGEAGTGHQHLAEGMVSGPLSPTLATRLAIRHSARDYQTDNVLTGKPVARPRDLAWRGSLLWQPIRGTDVTLRVGRHQSFRYVNGMVLRPYGRRSPQAFTEADPYRGNRFKIDQYALDIRHDLPSARLTLVTSHERTDGRLKQVTTRDLLRAWMSVDAEMPQYFANHGTSWNQDLQLGSLPGSDRFWVIGLNVHRGKRRNENSFLAQSAQRDFRYDSDALYGEATWTLSEALKLTTGLRHTRERKRYSATYRNAGTIFPPDSRRLRERQTTGRLGLTWALSAENSLYALIAKGQKSGGFNDYALQPADSRPYRSGKVNSVEAGFKHEAADGRLHLSSALFSNKVRDDHLLAYDPNQNFSSWTVNVDTESRGGELEAEWRMGRGFTLNGALIYIDGKITSSAVTNTPGGNVETGNRLPDVPRLSSLVALGYRRELPAVLGPAPSEFNARISARSVGRRASDPQNNFDLDAYQEIGLRIGIASGPGEIYLWGSNLLNQRYDLAGYFIKPGLTVGMPAHGRSMGLGLTYVF